MLIMIKKYMKEKEQRKKVTMELERLMESSMMKKGGNGRNAVIKEGRINGPTEKALLDQMIERWIHPYGPLPPDNWHIWGEDEDDFCQVFIRKLGFLDEEPDIELPEWYNGSYKTYWNMNWNVINFGFKKYKQGVHERVKRVLTGDVFSALLFEILDLRNFGRYF